MPGKWPATVTPGNPVGQSVSKGGVHKQPLQSARVEREKLGWMGLRSGVSSVAYVSTHPEKKGCREHDPFFLHAKAHDLSCGRLLLQGTHNVGATFSTSHLNTQPS